MVWNSGLRPLSVSSLYITVYALIVSASDLFFIGSANILFMSNLYKTSIQFYPWLETEGNRYVSSVHVCPSVSWMVTYMRFVSSMMCGSASGSYVSPVSFVFDFSFGLVLLAFFLCWFMWPFIVTSAFFRYCLT
jgi:hypothetical protein